jgi:hypothetical protein
VLRPGGVAVLNADDPLVIGMRERRDDVAIIIDVEMVQQVAKSGN